MRALIGLELVRKLPMKDLDVRDTRLPGFVVRCRASGKHSYVALLRRGRAMTLGKVSVLTPLEAREAARQALADVAKGIDPMADRRCDVPTWKRFLEDTYGPWATEHQKTGEYTVVRLRVNFSEFDSMLLTDLSAFAIERWRTGRLKSGVKPATTNRDLASLRSALTRAREWKILKTHPMADVKASRIDVIGHVRFLSADEETRLRGALAARDDRRRAAREQANVWRRERDYPKWPAFGLYTDHLTPIILLAMHTGCRRGELFQLRWRDVDLLAAQLVVRGAGTKSGKTRVIPLNSEAASVLRAWRPSQVEGGSYVFPGDDGEKLCGIKTAFLKLLKEAEVTRFRFHDLRHDFASKLVQAGVDLNTVRELLGHADLKMTLRYAHLAPEHKAAAVAKLVRTPA